MCVWAVVRGPLARMIAKGRKKRLGSLSIAKDGFVFTSVSAQFRNYQMAVCPRQQTLWGQDHRNPGRTLDAQHYLTAAA